MFTDQPDTGLPQSLKLRRRTCQPIGLDSFQKLVLREELKVAG
jgi:hypothetical protein